jgi:pyridoxal phosphate enzyme (YggS family)
LEEFSVSIAENVAQIIANVEQAVARRRQAALTGTTVKLVAVTKNQTAAAVREVLAAGVTTVGENRVQEAAVKAAELAAENAEWHLIGHLQTNKVRQAVPLFSLIHSLDSERLAVEIDQVAVKLGKRQDVLIQVNVAGEESKFGVEPKEAISLVRLVGGLANVRLAGLMTIAPYFDDPEEARPVFRKLYNMFMELKTAEPSAAGMEWLSMGMTNDYIVAVEEGANLIRVGTAIFGPRHY